MYVEELRRKNVETPLDNSINYSVCHLTISEYYEVFNKTVLITALTGIFLNKRGEKIWIVLGIHLPAGMF